MVMCLLFVLYKRFRTSKGTPLFIMDISKGKIIISGGKPLVGEIPVSGMKNAAVAIVLATILTEDKCVIENLPDIADINISLQILEGIGVKVTKLGKNTVTHILHITTPHHQRMAVNDTICRPLLKSLSN